MLFSKSDKQYKDQDPEIVAWNREGSGSGSDSLDAPLMYSFPRQEESMKDKKYFAVKDYEQALFYNKGELIDVLEGGVYELEKEARIKGTEIVWMDTSMMSIPWGVPKRNGIPTEDGCFIGLHGDLKLRINDAKTFYNDIVAGEKEWTVQDLKEWIMSLLHTSLRDIFKHYPVKEILLEDRERIINQVIAKVTEEFLKYGLELESFNLLGLKTSEEVEKILEQDKEQTLAVAGECREDLETLRENKKNIKTRISNLKAKKRSLQDKLLNDEIDEATYQKKKGHIERFLKEAKEELSKVKKLIND
ncbi:MAG: SPFH domain-containing protein [Promethearchaeia archaeon]